jgi:hypothetical protein
VFVTLLLCGMIALAFVGTAVSAETLRAKGQGTLTAVRDGMLIIAESGRPKDEGSEASNERGYLISSRAPILDSQGKKTSLDKLVLPTVIAYEYVFTPNGPEIRLIREVAQ